MSGVDVIAAGSHSRPAPAVPGQAMAQSPLTAAAPSLAAGGHARENFSQDFRRFFRRGLAALMPTLVTFWLLLKVWNFLWESIGQYLMIGLYRLANATSSVSPVGGWFTQLPGVSPGDAKPPWYVQAAGVVLAVVLVYFVGLFVGNFLGRAFWLLAERAVKRIPLVRAIYPAVKQVTDFLLADKTHHFVGSRVVAVQPHADGIWSIGLVTGPGVRTLSSAVGHEMVTVFVPSSPTAFSGYVLVVPRSAVVELPMSVEQAMQLLVSGGVINPEAASSVAAAVAAATAAAVAPASPAGPNASSAAGKAAGIRRIGRFTVGAPGDPSEQLKRRSD